MHNMHTCTTCTHTHALTRARIHTYTYRLHRPPDNIHAAPSVRGSSFIAVDGGAGGTDAGGRGGAGGGIRGAGAEPGNGVGRQGEFGKLKVTGNGSGGDFGGGGGGLGPPNLTYEGRLMREVGGKVHRWFSDFRILQVTGTREIRRRGLGGGGVGVGGSKIGRLTRRPSTGVCVCVCVCVCVFHPFNFKSTQVRQHKQLTICHQRGLLCSKICNIRKKMTCVYMCNTSSHTRQHMQDRTYKQRMTDV